MLQRDLRFQPPPDLPNLAAAYLRRALALLGEDGGIVRATILDALGSALVRGRDASPVAAARTAIECYREAARIYQQCARLDDWARTCFNLGNTLCDLSEMGGEDHWREAVFHYEESLRVRTREKDPERHAAVLENLGSAYRSLSGGVPGDNVKKSIRCYQRALRVYTPASNPEKSAAVENNLGNALLVVAGNRRKDQGSQRAARPASLRPRPPHSVSGQKQPGLRNYPVQPRRGQLPSDKSIAGRESEGRGYVFGGGPGGLSILGDNPAAARSSAVGSGPPAGDSA